MPDQIRIHRLIKHDPIFKKWLTAVPELRYPANASAPWRVFVQKTPGGPWAKKEYPTYPEAFKTLRKHLPECYDAAINCRPQGYEPPKVTQKYKARVAIRTKDGVKTGRTKVVIKKRRLYMPLPDGHSWCPYCRRPTIFRPLRSHGLFKITQIENKPIRCTLCGVREQFVKQVFPLYPFSTTLLWPVNGG